MSQIYYQMGDEKRGDHFFYLFEQAAPYNVYGNFETHRRLCQEFLDAERFADAESAIQALSEWWLDNKGTCPLEIQVYELLATAKISSAQGDTAQAESRKTRASGLALQALDETTKPVVCAARGELRGGGAGILLGADIRIVGASARIGWLHARMGIASISGPATLARAVPTNIAYEMMFTCDYLAAERAHALGLVNQLVADERLDEALHDTVAKVAANAPLATTNVSRRMNAPRAAT